MKRRCFNENALIPFVKAQAVLDGRRWTKDQADQLKALIDAGTI